MEVSLQMDHHNQIIDFLIIGGGIAGLSVVNRLVDLDEQPVLVESMDYPTHKVCGEFISQEALPYLEDWGIIPESVIKKATFFAGSRPFDFVFPKEAASISRYILDKRLAERAQKKGAILISNTRVVELKNLNDDADTLFSATLSDGRILYARHVFVGGGRFFNTSKDSIKPQMPYFGFKAHFTNVEIEDTLEMHAMPDAYIGISPIEKGVVNVACLVKVNKEIKDPQQFISHLMNSNDFKHVKERLEKGKMVFDWLYTQAPAFQARPNPYQKNVYFIGDAAGTIAPATGNGLGMAITSGYMAADYAVLEDHAGFCKAWKKMYSSRIKRGQLLHKVMMNKTLTKASFFICKYATFIPKIIFSITRGK